MSLTDEAPGSFFLANDGARLYYEEAGTGPPLVLIHGWSGSSAMFTRNAAPLATRFRTIRMDLRGHGRSETTRHGARVPRLAMDLSNLLDHLRLESGVAMLGCSLGCAVIWAFVELFGNSRVRAVVLVDQSPYQMYAADGSWQLGSNGLYSEAALAHLCALLHVAPDACHDGTVDACLTDVATADERSFFVGEARKAHGWFLAKLMQNHNHNDWRDVLPRVTAPALVVAGGKSKIFPVEGVAYAATAMPNGRLETFENGSHWLYYEEAERFNRLITDFLMEVL